MKKETPAEKAQKVENNLANRRQNKPTKRFNGWMVAFFILLGLLLGSGIFLASRIYAIREPADKLPAQTSVKKDEPTFQVQLTKSQVNQIIDFYLKEYLESSQVKYRFYLENQALLNGTFKLLGQEVQFYLYFEPYVLENGNIQLNAKSLSIGTLDLPIGTVMSYIRKSYDLPKWVKIDSDQNIIYLYLDQFKLKNGMKISAGKINLIDDDIRFGVYLPLK